MIILTPSAPETEQAWTCSKCGLTYMVLPSLFKWDRDHMCEPIVEKLRKAYYFYRIRHDNFMKEFCVANWMGDPNQVMETKAPDGTIQSWDKRIEGDLLVFKAPDGYDGGPVGWKYDRRKQQGVDIDDGHVRYLLEKLALENKVSVIVK